MGDGSRRSWGVRTVTLMAGVAVGAIVAPAYASADTKPGAHPDPREEVTYFYGAHPQNLVDAFWHDRTELQPGILLLHGGYWVAGDKSAWQNTARWFSDRGYAVFSANYRLVQDAPWPAQRNDVLNVVSYIKKHAAQFDLDPDRLGVLGSSAGGQLAATLATYGTASRRVSGVVALSPVSSPYQAYLDGAADTATSQRKRLRRTAVRLASCRPGRTATCWSRWYSMNPKNAVTKGDAPMLIVHSAGDLVSPSESRGLRDALRAKGVTARLAVLPGADHAFALLKHPGMQKRVLHFFDRVTDAPDTPASGLNAVNPTPRSATPEPTRDRSSTPPGDVESSAPTPDARPTDAQPTDVRPTGPSPTEPSPTDSMTSPPAIR